MMDDDDDDDDEEEIGGRASAGGARSAGGGLLRGLRADGDAQQAGVTHPTAALQFDGRRVSAM